MREPEDKSPAEVLRVKQLEIVDDEGRVRALLGTDREGRTSLSVFDQSDRIRISLGASAIPEQGGGLSFLGTNGKLRAGLGLHENGQAGLSFSAAQKDRDITISAGDEGNLYLVFTEKDIPMVGLGLTEGEDKDLSSELALVDRDGRAGVVISGGRRSDPHVRLLDRRPKVRASFELGANGQPGQYAFDEEGADSRSANALDREVEGGSLYHAVSFSAALVVGGPGGPYRAAPRTTKASEADGWCEGLLR
jgi:hypothetical protein